MMIEKTEKEYGKLSLDQFKRITKELPEIRNQMQELPDLIRSTPKLSAQALCAGDNPT